MKNKITKILKYLKTKISGAFQSIKHPGPFLARLILSIFRNTEKIPYPLFIFIYNNLGGRAGITIELNRRQIEYNKRVIKARNILIILFGVAFILSVVIIGLKQGNNNFLFGFSQNLISDIILILFVIYILPKQLNKPKKYSISIDIERFYKEDDESNKLSAIIISVINIGEEVYKNDEIMWEIFVPYEFLDKENILVVNGKVDISEPIYLKMWKFHGINESSLFINQELSIVRLKFSRELFTSGNLSQVKIYYILRTINGNIPKPENITKDFLGMGVPANKYPSWGEVILVA